MLVIGFAGLAQSGKTTAAEYFAGPLIDQGYNVTMCRFADDLKKAMAMLGADKETNYELYRKTAIDVGGNMRDPEYVPGVTGPDYWVKRTSLSLTRLLNEDALNSSLAVAGDTEYHERVVLFDDIRYVNELGMINKFNGHTIFIDGWKRLRLPAVPPLPFPYDTESERMAVVYSNGEGEDEWFDRSVVNSGSMEQFKKKLNKCLMAILHKEYTNG